MSHSRSTPPRKNKKGWRIIIITLIAILALVLISVGVVFAMTSRIFTNSVPIVAATPQPESTPVPTPDLPTITGEPSDVGEDVDEPLPTPASTPVPIYQKVPINENAINILVIGQDVRPNESGTGRSDTMMILSYNRKEGKASIVSLMRDTWVPIKGLGWNRLNASFSYGGVGLTVNTINELFNLDVQNYVIVNFDGMKDLVDKIGGVDVEITDVEAAYYNSKMKWNISAGLQHLDGTKALVHARNRSSNGGDFERVRRQQDIMMAVYKKLITIHDPVVLGQLINFMMQNVKTNMPADKIFTLGMEIVEKGGLNIQRGRVPADKTWTYARKEGRSVITIDF